MINDVWSEFTRIKTKSNEDCLFALLKLHCIRWQSLLYAIAVERADIFTPFSLPLSFKFYFPFYFIYLFLLFRRIRAPIKPTSQLVIVDSLFNYLHLHVFVYLFTVFACVFLCNNCMFIFPKCAKRIIPYLEAINVLKFWNLFNTYLHLHAFLLSVYYVCMRFFMHCFFF
jgi:hypothetical protein